MFPNFYGVSSFLGKSQILVDLVWMVKRKLFVDSNGGGWEPLNKYVFLGAFLMRWGW